MYRLCNINVEIDLYNKCYVIIYTVTEQMDKNYWLICLHTKCNIWLFNGRRKNTLINYHKITNIMQEIIEIND